MVEIIFYRLCSLLSVFRTVVMGTYLIVVLSGRWWAVWFLIIFVVVNFGCWVVDVIGSSDVNTFDVVVDCCADGFEWNGVAVVDGGDDPNGKWGIVFWSILFSIISGSTIAASS